MKRYAITEGLGVERAMQFARWNLARAVDMLQVREKQFTARELLALVEDVLRLPNPGGTRILVNSRLDIALAAGAHGVHFPADAQVVAPGSSLILGKSCHSLQEIQQAADQGADFAVFGPVFATGDKSPQGLSALREACASARIPVYALGGINDRNAPACMDAGATGIAGISLFRPIAE